ncbi:MAG: hypothetical protein J3Q66DRAFT_375610 [Benniella sp.]|nr:MAG: hypothetical protein J3Q66DRAFT_375610 [Benniella sp.]
MTSQRISFYRGGSTVLAYILTLLTLSSILVRAQSYQPTIATQTASAFIDGHGLFILSGVTPSHSLSYQTFMIDLSVSWNTNSPVYKPLSIGPLQSYSPSAISADGDKWFTMVKGVGQVYDIRTDKWTQISTNTNTNTNTNNTMEQLWGRGAATDPVTGLIYIPFAFPNGNSSYSMLKVNLTDGSIASDNTTQTLQTQDQYAVAWSTPLRSLVYVGEDGAYTYNSTNGWKLFSTPPKGTLPLGSCLVPANGGSQMILFGGYSKTTNVTLGDIYILDVATSTWKMGPSVPIPDRRQTPACAVSNDHFIAWGGNAAVGNDVVAPANMTLVYNLKTNTWTTEYVVPPPETVHAAGGSVSKAVVASTVVAIVMVLLLVVGGVIVYRRRSRRSGPCVTKSPAPCTLLTPPVPPPKNRARNSQHKRDRSSAATVVGQVEAKHKGEIGTKTVGLGADGSRPFPQRPKSCAKVTESKGIAYNSQYLCAPPVYVSPHSYSSREEQPASMEVEGTVTDVIRLYIDE